MNSSQHCLLHKNLYTNFSHIHCRPGITQMSESTTSDRVISESRYTKVFWYITNYVT